MNDLGNYVCSNNYVYDPDASDPADVFTFDGSYSDDTAQYTQTEFEAQTETSAPRVMYYKVSSEGSDNLMTGASGSDQYITRGAHEMRTGVTVADGGVDVAHPYLAGVTIPAYVGAVDPSDSDWVDGVFSDVTSVAWLTAQRLGSTPSWIEVE